MLLENTRVVMGSLAVGACLQRDVEELGEPKMHPGPLCGSFQQVALMGGEAENLILLPDSTESNDSSNTKARRMLVIVTGSSFSWLWGCFVVCLFFKVL